MKKIVCPKCKCSDNIEIMGEKKKGFSVTKSVVGGALTGGIGLLAGFIGKKGKYDMFCKNCGHRWRQK
jgi:hypothetical protein|nr:MAG TPA: transcription factor IIS-like protein [Caudoviricetes sp.]